MRKPCPLTPSLPRWPVENNGVKALGFLSSPQPTALMAAAGSGLNLMDVIHAFGCELAELGPCNFLYAVGNRIYAFASRRRYPNGEREPGLWRLARQCKEDKTDIVAPGVHFRPGIAVDQQIILCASIPITEEEWQPFSVNELICISKGRQID